MKGVAIGPRVITIKYGNALSSNPNASAAICESIDTDTHVIKTNIIIIMHLSIHDVSIYTRVYTVHQMSFTTKFT